MQHHFDNNFGKADRQEEVGKANRAGEISEIFHKAKNNKAPP